jgi:hypothetical protein
MVSVGEGCWCWRTACSQALSSNGGGGTVLVSELAPGIVRPSLDPFIQYFHTPVLGDRLILRVHDPVLGYRLFRATARHELLDSISAGSSFFATRANVPLRHDRAVLFRGLRESSDLRDVQTRRALGRRGTDGAPGRKRSQIPARRSASARLLGCARLESGVLFGNSTRRSPASITEDAGEDLAGARPGDANAP